MAVGDVSMLQFFYHVQQRQFINTLHYIETKEETGLTNLSGLVDAWSLKFQAGLENLFSDDMRFGCLKGNDVIAPAGKRNPAVTYYRDQAGTNTGRALPGNTVCRVNYYGQLHSRTIRGGSNLGGLRVIDEDLNGPTAAIQTIIDTEWTTKLLETVVGAGSSTGEWAFGFLSRAPVIPGDPLEPYPGVFVTTDFISISPFFGTLRSRQGTHTAVDSSV